MKFKTQYNAQDFKQRGEINYMPSKTIPDQTMSIRELLQRHTRGLPLPQNSNYYFDGEEEFQSPDFSRMDLAEVEEFKLKCADELEQIGIREKEKKEAKKLAELEKKQKRDNERIANESKKEAKTDS